MLNIPGGSEYFRAVNVHMYKYKYGYSNSSLFLCPGLDAIYSRQSFQVLYLLSFLPKLISGEESCLSY